MSSLPDESWYNCQQCDGPVAEHHRYCGNCGSYLGTLAVPINIFNNVALRRMFMFYFIYLFTGLIVKHTSWFNTYKELIWIEVFLALITLAFAWQNRKQLLPVLQTRHLRVPLMMAVMCIAIGASLLVSYWVRQVNVSFYDSDVSYYGAYRRFSFPVIMMIWSIAVLPAFIEELAFRGVMYNYSLSFLNERVVVTVTSLLFAFMHLSLFSLVWLIPFSFFIGYLRRHFHTLWYGIIFHFAFNLTACVIDLYREGQILFFK